MDFLFGLNLKPAGCVIRGRELALLRTIGFLDDRGLIRSSFMLGSRWIHSFLGLGSLKASCPLKLPPLHRLAFGMLGKRVVCIYDSGRS